MSRQTFNRGSPSAFVCLPVCQRGESGEETLKNKVCRKKTPKMSSSPTPPPPRIKVHYEAGAEVLPPHLQSLFLWYFTKSPSVKGRQWEEKREERLIFFFFFFKMGHAGVQRKSRSNYLSFDLKSVNILKVVHHKKEGQKLGEREKGEAEKEKTGCFVLPMTDGCFLLYFIMHVSAATQSLWFSG